MENLKLLTLCVVTMTLAAIVGDRGQDWHLLTAGAFVSMAIPLFVFFSLQRYFVRGLLACLISNTFSGGQLAG